MLLKLERKGLGVLLKKINGINAWRKRGYASPSPHFIKQLCLIRNSTAKATWVESGTYLAETTIFLARKGNIVHTIEPEPKLYERARKICKKYPNVHIYNDISENVLPVLLPKLNGDINFWLDGHYSKGITFQGPSDTPILSELNCISANIEYFDKISVFIDDVRCFKPALNQYSNYPDTNTLLEWATSNKLNWEIEHDIFIAKNT